MSVFSITRMAWISFCLMYVGHCRSKILWWYLRLLSSLQLMQQLRFLHCSSDSESMWLGYPQVRHSLFALQWVVEWPNLPQLKHRLGRGMNGLIAVLWYPILICVGSSSEANFNVMRPLSIRVSCAFFIIFLTSTTFWDFNSVRISVSEISLKHSLQITVIRFFPYALFARTTEKNHTFSLSLWARPFGCFRSGFRLSANSWAICLSVFEWTARKEWNDSRSHRLIQAHQKTDWLKNSTQTVFSTICLLFDAQWYVV